MLRTLPLACLVLIAGCASSGDDVVAGGEPKAYAVVTNDDIVTYTLFVNGVRFGRVRGSTTSRIALPEIPLDGLVTFTAESGTRAEEESVSWSPTIIDPGADIELRIRYRAR